MRFFSEEGEPATWFEVLFFWPLAGLGFLLIVSFLMFVPE